MQYDDQRRGLQTFKTIDQVHVQTRWIKRMGWDNQIRRLQTIHQVHVHPGDGRRGWDDIIRDERHSK